MIVPMSKVTIMGPKEMLMDTLECIHRLGVMQINEDIHSEIQEHDIPSHPVLPGRKSLALHRYYLNLQKKIDQLLSCFPEKAKKRSNLHVQATLTSITGIISSHLHFCKTKTAEKDHIVSKIDLLQRYDEFLDDAGSFLEGEQVHEDLDYFGFKLQDQDDFEQLRQQVEDVTSGYVVLEHLADEDDKILVLVVVEKKLSQKVQKFLDTAGIAVIESPLGYNKLPFSEQQPLIRKQYIRAKEDLALLEQDLHIFSQKWLPIYQDVKGWLKKQFAVIKASAAVYETEMCFFIYGWLPSDDLPQLIQTLEQSFVEKVLVEEHEIVEKDLGNVPTALHNPSYFQPFELFTRLLPIPSYGSVDLTPFIGIFFPVFFGMMLGDIGYGLILLVLALFLVRLKNIGSNIRDAGKILLISSVYTIFFGGLYGEFFGTAGHAWFGLQPLLFDRHKSLVPMLGFALAAGVVHVTLGLVLGTIVDIRKQRKKEAIFKALSIVFVLIVCSLILSIFSAPFSEIRRPLLITVAIIVPVLIFTGGVLAPLELLKSIGNIISYARIMAVGLTSVLLAYVANYMAGMSGSVWAGIVVVLVLHSFNLLLGVFAPTIHSLRLHYVEFLSKFSEPGGHEFKPLGSNR